MQRPPSTASVLMGRLASVFALGLALAVASPVVDLGAARVDLANADFAAGLQGWSTGGVPLAPALAAPDGRPVLAAAIPAGGEAWVEQGAAPGSLGLDPAPASVWLGQRLAARARVRREPGAAASVARLEVLRRSAGGDEVVAVGSLDLALAPVGRWLDVVAQPLPGAAGRVEPGTVEVRTRLTLSGAGTTLLDRIVLGPYEARRMEQLDGGFEAGQEGWELQAGALQEATAAVSSQQGTTHLELQPGGEARAPLDLAPEPGRPWPGASLALGAWLRMDEPAGLSGQPQPGVEAELALWALRRSGSPVRLAHGAWRPTTRDAKAWRWFEVPAATAIPADAVRLEVQVRSSLPAPMLVDGMQAGEPAAVDGTPPTLRLAVWQAWYRSPAHPAASGAASTPRELWRNWAWQTPAPCAPGSTALLHDPSFVRTNGRRDGAVGEVDGEEALPLVGLYDSRDARVARLAVDLARASGLDGFVVDLHGSELDAQETLPGETRLEQRALEVLLSAAERPGVDFRVAPMLEPKVLQAGWVRPGAPLSERREALTAELLALVQRYGARRPMLRVDGELVVFVFWHDLPGWDGQALDEDAWAQLEAEVEAASGDRVRLCATHPPSPSSATFRGYARWHLVDSSVARYASFQDFASGQEQVPAAGAVEALARTVNDEARAWSALDEVGRRPWTVAWWGFDDSGVAGWASPHWPGSDGQPSCVRVTAEVGPAFLSATLGTGERARVLLPTWNDWNERTALEPAWDAVYEAQLRGGLAVEPAARERSLAGLLTLQQELGAAAGPERLDALLRAYFADVTAGRAVAYQ